MKNYKKSFLLFTHIILSSILIFFILLAMKDYSKNILMGFSLSIVILLSYFFVLKKSIDYFKQNRLGIAYFLTIGGFFSLLFLQMINCSNSIRWMH